MWAYWSLPMRNIGIGVVSFSSMILSITAVTESFAVAASVLPLFLHPIITAIMQTAQTHSIFFIATKLYLSMLVFAAKPS